MVRLVKSEPPEEETPKPEPSGTKAKRAAASGGAVTLRHRWWQLPLLLIFAVAFLSSGWFTYKIAAATDRIFTENLSGGSPVLKGKKLKDEDRINILLIGIGGLENDAPNLSDTIQVVSIAPKQKRVSMLSIPRDLYVQVPNSFQKTKINEIHALGEDQGLRGGGPALLKETVSDITGVPIHYFIRVDFAGFRQAIDALGGIDINVTQRLYDPYYPTPGHGYQILDIRPGHVHMNGELALKYARSRETTSDFDRSRRQQEVLVAARDKAMSVAYLTNPGKLSQLIDILGDHVKSDLSFGESERLAEIVRDIPSGNVTSKVIDGAETGLLYDSIGPGGAYILLPRSGDYSDIREFVAQLLANPAIQAEQAQIEVQNASGRAGLAKSEGDLLTAYGYNIVAVTNAPAIGQRTVIYDYTDGKKPATLEFLTKRYQAQVIKQPAPRPGVDFGLVIGTDYLSHVQIQTAR